MGLFRSKQSVGALSLCKTLLIGGEAGQGIKLAGKIIAYTLLSLKFNVNMYDEYPSLIRGGHNCVSVTFSKHPVYSTNKEVDFLVCLDRNTLIQHRGELNANSIVIYDNSIFSITEKESKDYPCEFIPIETEHILKQGHLPSYCKNIVCATAGLIAIGIEKDILTKAVEKILGKKKEKLAYNIKAINDTYARHQEIFNIRPLEKKEVNKIFKKRYFMNGNEAAGIGAIEAGIGFYSAYPMTPASSLLDFMFKQYKKYNFIVKQTEDEIAAINMAIGASFAGTRAMVGTSGGGFSLMVEGLGLAAITETPLVIYLSQRPGPATGMATWTGQTDLLFVLHASQDEFPRIILTPTDQAEVREMTFLAFNLAEKYQIPVFILVDKYLSETYSTLEFSSTSIKKINRGLILSNRALARLEDFKRYEFTDSGISPRSIPGQINGIHLANSDESDEYGYSDESSVNRQKKMQKRFKKVEDIISHMPELNIYGDYRSKTCLCTWGSSKGAALEAIRRLQSKGISVKLVALNYIEPFPVDELKKVLHSAKKLLTFEQNYSGQLRGLIFKHTGRESDSTLNKYDGRPFFPDEIEDFIIQNIQR